MQVRVMEKEALSSLEGEDWVDNKRHCYVEGRRVYVPVRPGYPADCTLPDRKPYHGRGFQMIGDVAVLHGPRPGDEEVDAVSRERKPRGIVWLRAYKGPMRIPETEVLRGSAGETVHREQGITWHIDPLRVMFAKGNREEKVRMQRLTTHGERVADMFAGIGYFTIPVAIKGAFVHAMEINPEACAFLQRNTRANRVEERVMVSCGDCRSLLSGKYDRIIMGHFEAPCFLSSALAHVHPGSVLHVHSTGKVPPDLDDALGMAGFRADIATRKVKKYSPGTWHFVQDVTCR